MKPAFPYAALAAYYFWYFASVGIAVPYLPSWLKGQGYEVEALGWLMGLLTIGRIVAPALWARAADHRGEHLQAIRLATACAALSFMLIPAAAGFWWQAAALLVFGCVWSTSLPLVESFTLAALAERPEGYTGIRLWGSFGFIGAVLVGGVLSPAERLPYLMAVPLGLCVVATLCLPPMPVIAADSQGRESDPRGWRFSLAGLIAVAFLVQFAHGPYYSFFTVYLQDLGYQDGEIGSFWALGVVAEVLLFLSLPRWVATYRPEHLLCLAALGGFVRWALLGFAAHDPLWLGIAQALHALTFGLHHATAVVMVHQRVPKRHAGTAQALYSSLSFGLGGALGSIAAGSIWAHWGAEFAFGVAALGSALAVAPALLLLTLSSRY